MKTEKLISKRMRLLILIQEAAAEGLGKALQLEATVIFTSINRKKKSNSKSVIKF
jgi:hypothetical protein